MSIQQDQIQNLITIIDDIHQKLENLEKIIASQQAELKKKWRADIKKELKVYNHNSFCDNGQEKEVVYSDTE
jgi:hypothetical protein